MKKFLIFPFVFALLLSGEVKSQVLNVPLVVQEQNQWCWAGCSKCILDYFGDTLNQCTIAEYARTSITWTSFGNVDCCVDPSQGCNYWNYNYGSLGSIQDILVHFNNVQNYGVAYAISIPTVNAEIAAGRPFVIRWGWTSGGGHFIVGHGINSSNDVYYMNPWPGEGFHIAQYSWVLSDGVHNWTHTNILTSSPLNVSENSLSNDDVISYPNPFEGTTTIQYSLNSLPVADAYIELRDISGRIVQTQVLTTENGAVEMGSTLAGGVYFVRIVNGNEISQAIRVVKTR